MKSVIDFVKADYSKATFIKLFLLIKKLNIIFDYNNPNYNNYRIIIFKIRRHIESIFIPATKIYKKIIYI
jgi:hypothetical protein